MSFVTEDILESLKIKSEPVSVNINTMTGKNQMDIGQVNGLVIEKLDGTSKLELPKLYTKEQLPVDKSDIAGKSVTNQWPYLRKISKQMPEIREDIPVALLLGNNVPKALEPHECIRSEQNGPYAVKTLYGWTVCGPVGTKTKSDFLKSNAIRVNTLAVSENGVTVMDELENAKDNYLMDIVQEMYKQDYVEKFPHKAESIEDQEFMNLMEAETKFGEEQKYILPMPVRKNAKLPNRRKNRSEAYRIAMLFKEQLLRNPKMAADFIEFMGVSEDMHHCDIVPDDESECSDDEIELYLVYQAAYHRVKKKFRFVYNCSKNVGGPSLNSILMTGPAAQLTNNMGGVLIRFRKERYAIIADIEKMFYQALVPKHQRNMLRFFWWPKGNFEKEPVVYRMNVHLFGASSSPSVANYALKRTATDNAESFSREAIETVLNDMYVDDLLKSVSTKKRAIELVQELTELCARGGFKLTKFLASHSEIIESIPVEYRSSAVKNLNFEIDQLPVERALGVYWKIENDTLGFKVEFKDRPFTRRGLFSNFASFTDLLGLVAPFLLKGRRMLQELCRSKLGWDDPLDSDTCDKWLEWRDGLCRLETLEIHRCYKTEDFGEVKSAQLHAFADASEFGYGAAVYLRQTDEHDHVDISLVMGKARVVPLSGETIPRSELVATTIASELADFIRREIQIPNIQLYVWTDSQVVLGYVNNTTKRTKSFVTNRVRKIRDVMENELENLRHVPTKLNPADDASRGLDANKIDQLCDHRWFSGPQFLSEPEHEWPKRVDTEIDEEDPEVRKSPKVIVTNMDPTPDPILKLIETKSNWNNVLDILAVFIRCTDKSLSPVQARERAKMNIFRKLQGKHFSKELQKMAKGKNLPKESALGRLDAFVDGDGVIRVGGRLQNTELLDDNCKHPIILPSHDHVTDIFIRRLHEHVGHGGRNATLNHMRRHGIWIINANARVRGVLHKCVNCRKSRGKQGTQKMAPLPQDRTVDTPPFTYVGVDLFGHFLVKDGRKEVKRYGAVFTCLNSRAVHIETVESLETDSFINALRRFVNRRGNIRKLRCDNGTNFVGARNEFENCWEEIDLDEVAQFLKQNGADFEWKHNIPPASHMGGVWERMIRSIRQILSSLLVDHPCQLTKDTLDTFLVEVEGILNSRPLTVETINDPHSPLPLAPINLLTLKSNVIMPPPGVFDGKADIYTRRQWRRVQHLSQEFWDRYRKEYLSTLQARQKWLNNKRNFEIGDIVLLQDDSLGRNHWPMAKVISTFPDKKDVVRSVTVRVSRSNLKKEPSVLNRPINKIVLLVEAEKY